MMEQPLTFCARRSREKREIEDTVQVPLDRDGTRILFALLRDGTICAIDETVHHAENIYFLRGEDVCLADVNAEQAWAYLKHRDTEVSWWENWEAGERFDLPEFPTYIEAYVVSNRSLDPDYDPISVSPCL